MKNYKASKKEEYVDQKQEKVIKIKASQMVAAMDLLTKTLRDSKYGPQVQQCRR